MKRLLLLTFVIMLGAALALAQPGRIALYGTNVEPYTCAVSGGTGLISVYVFHIDSQGAAGSQYSAPKPDCVSGIWIADQNPFPVTVGSSQIGVSVGYGLCRQSPILVQTILYSVGAPTPACCIYEVKADPNAEPPGIYMVDCEDNLLNPLGQSAVINEQPTCTCAMIVPVQETSWGQIKALYTE